MAKPTQPARHEPVLLKEVLDIFAPAPGKVIVDATLGQGGHSLAIARQLGDEGLLVGIDRDPQMLEAARMRFEAAHIPCSRYRLIHADHAQQLDALADVLAQAQVDPPAPDGLLFDLGPSTPQLLDPRRGMSWESDEALDMRMDSQAEGLTAARIVNEWDERRLARLLRDLADERWAGPIARRIVQARRKEPIQTGRQLGRIVAGAIPRRAWPPRTHPATRTFLALRIEVNDEFGQLERALPAGFTALRPGGRMAVISFHSGEDRRVKRFMRAISTAPAPPWPLPQGESEAPGRLLTPRPIAPGPVEVAANPRSRSAKLRAIEKAPVGC
jgi:16S rRNA (cytosine1402-N4)-methyltransferase